MCSFLQDMSNKNTEAFSWYWPKAHIPLACLHHRATSNTEADKNMIYFTGGFDAGAISYCYMKTGMKNG